MKLVAATDFSEGARNAVLRAAQLASQLGAELELLHVVSPPSLRLIEDARHLLEEAAAAAGTPARARLAVGEVAQETLAAAAGAWLLALGARGLNPLRDALLGTTAERLVGRCACPILVVRHAPTGAYENLAVALDLQPGSARLLEQALALAPQAEITAVHGYDVPFEATLRRAGVPEADIEGEREKAQRTALAAIQKLGRKASAGRHRVRAMAAHGNAVRVVSDTVRALAADLVVLGKRRRSALESAVLGSVTRQVLSEVGVDVLVVPEA